MVSINSIVHNQVVTYANELSGNFANEVSKQIGDGFVNVEALANVVGDFLTEADFTAPNAEEYISNWIASILKATPYIYNIWVSFEPGGFYPDARFSRDFVNLGDSIVAIPDLDDDKLGDPEEAPWYYYPFTTGETWFESADWYDYGLGGGSKYTGTISMPIIRDGEIVGVFGVDMLYENIFRFLNERQIAGERKILIVTQEGEIVFAADSGLLRMSLFDPNLALEKKDYVREALSVGGPFSVSTFSPFHGAPSIMFFYPTSRMDSRSAELFLCIDMQTDKLFRKANDVGWIIIAIGVLGLLIFTVILFFTVKGILKPIKRLTESVDMIVSGHIDANLASILDAELRDYDKRSKDEFYTLFTALKSMGKSMVMSEKYKAMSEAKSDFLAKMSHEIRTPMNAITGMAELALREEMPPAAKEHVFTIKQAGANLLSIINDILDLSKIESGKLDIAPIDYSFSSLANDVISIIRMRVANSAVRLTVNVDRKIPSVLYGDEVRLRQVLLNLLNNAVKYTKEGTISFTVRGEIIDLKTVLLTISISDTGIGIKEENIEKLFGSFIQVDADANRGLEGTGLGLAITKSLTTAMGGEITVESEYGKGSVFTVALPQKIRSHQPLAAVEKPEEKSVLIYERCDTYARSMAETLNNLGVANARADNDAELREKLESGKYPFAFIDQALHNNDTKNILKEINYGGQIVLLANFGSATVSDEGLSVIATSAYSISIANVLNGVADNFTYNADAATAVKFSAPNAKILVVDDIRTNLEVAKGLLSPYGMQIDTCLSGAEAIDAVTAHRYDLVFMDHMMPEMDGIETVKRIRELCGAHSYIPIVALTANAVYGTKEMFLQNGFNDFLSKPVDILKLGATLERWVPRAKQLPPLTDKIVEESKELSDIAIDGIDVRTGIARTGESASLYLKTLAVFRIDGQNKIDEINKCLETDDLKLYTTYVHALKSALANVGALELSEAAKGLETAGKRGDWDFLRENTPYMLSELENLLRGISEALSAGKEKDGGQTAAIDIEALKTALASLKTAIDDIDPGGISAAIRELERFEKADEIGGIIEEIARNVLNGGYDEAETLIERLILRTETPL
jgi:signal transduction histidine kinase/CheY-like chemotaxis protein